MDVLKSFLNGFELATVHLEMALWVYTVWNHGVSRICDFLSSVKFETLLAMFPRYHFFSLLIFSDRCQRHWYHPHLGTSLLVFLSLIYTGQFLLVYSFLFLVPKFTFGSSLSFLFPH